MKHSTEQLILANHVRIRVEELLDSACPTDLDGAESRQWKNTNFPAYTKRALAELEMFADLISEASQGSQLTATA